MDRNFNDNIFVLEAFDQVTKCVCAEWRVRIKDVDQLRLVLAPESDDDTNLTCSYYDVSKRDMNRIGKLCLPPVVPHEIFTGFSRPSFAFDHIPYLVHTNFELPLMLEGRKPLAVFGDSYPSQWFDDFLSPFESFVASSQLVRQIVDTPMPHLKDHRPDLDGMRRVLFALPQEAWRIDAYIENILNRTRDWDDDLERLQGELLGYEDWQNDWWIQERAARR